jgi:hypothetical protein
VRRQNINLSHPQIASGAEDTAPVTGAEAEKSAPSSNASGVEDAIPSNEAAEEQSEPSPIASDVENLTPASKAGVDHNIAGQRPLDEPSHADLPYLTVFPGEDRDAFDQLHREVIAEYQPSGPTEEDLALTIAWLVWRKNRLDIFERIGIAQYNIGSISAGKFWSDDQDIRVRNLSRMRLYANFLKLEEDGTEHDEAY